MVAYCGFLFGGNCCPLFVFRERDAVTGLAVSVTVVGEEGLMQSIAARLFFGRDVADYQLVILIEELIVPFLHFGDAASSVGCWV